MGCDIHLYREKQIGGQWLTADEWEIDEDGDKRIAWEKRAYTGRNYKLFGILAKGVRGEEYAFSFEKRGMPANACPEVAEKAESWGCDGHSHSFLYLHELKDLVATLEKTTICISGMKDREQLAELRASMSSGSPDWDLLWPFCAWGTGENLESFEIEIPAMEYLGLSLRTIIDSFDGIDGDNHRFVFFFDS